MYIWGGGLRENPGSDFKRSYLENGKRYQYGTLFWTPRTGEFDGTTSKEVR